VNTSEEYILNQPEPYRGILLYLQSVIEGSIPDVELKYKYKLPFYYINSRPYCYFKPKQGLCGSRFLECGPFNGAFGANEHRRTKNDEIPPV
jgi:hypothetical protein